MNNAGRTHGKRDIAGVVIRWGIRRLLRKRLQEEYHGDTEVERLRQREFFDLLRKSPLAVATDAANEQHYELPPDFFSLVLGPRRKYSSCLYPIGVNGIAAAEEAMLALTCRRAGIVDGMEVLELGCGWGSLTLWVAGITLVPASRLTPILLRNASTLDSVCRENGVANVRFVTADMAKCL